MQIFNVKSKIIITCSNRLSPYLLAEVTALGYKPEQVFKTGVQLNGTMEDCINLNMQLRCAAQVLFLLKTVVANNADELYTALNVLEWEKIIPAHGYFSISSNVHNDTINNSLFANVKVKDAIVDRFRTVMNTRPNSGSSLDKTVIHLYWNDTVAEVFIDTSGETLSKHGYRRIPGKAPMIESLAAATLLATKWDRQSPFINPMCGSGTLAIEAAMLATNRKPGLYRDNYAFMHLVDYDDKVYQELLATLKAQVNDELDLQIIANDISQDAINVSKINAGAAGVADYISFVLGDFTNTPIPVEGEGVVLFNPEYGDRLGNEIALQATYKLMGDFMKKECKGYKGYIFTGNLELAKKIGLKPSRRIEFFNGKIDCRLLEYELYSGSKDPDKQQTKDNVAE